MSRATVTSKMMRLIDATSFVRRVAHRLFGAYAVVLRTTINSSFCESWWDGSRGLAEILGSCHQPNLGANFGELRHHEVRTISLVRGWVNQGQPTNRYKRHSLLSMGRISTP